MDILHLLIGIVVVVIVYAVLSALTTPTLALAGGLVALLVVLAQSTGTLNRKE
jgi:uncharacterized membrane protein YkgB